MNSKHKIRSKADAPEIRRLFEAGWLARGQAIENPQETETARASIRAQLARLYPPADMVTLSRYGFAKARDSIRVEISTSDPFRWDQAVAFPLGETVLLPDSAGLTAGGFVWRDEEGGRGLNPGVWERYSDSEKRQAREYWESRARDRVQADATPWFIRRAEAAAMYKAECRALWEWPATGRTWLDLFEAFPAIREAREAEQLSEAAE